MLRQITQPKCYPISLAQARKHLSVDSSDRSNDVLINLLIEAATADSQMKTGRIWVNSEWEWKPDTIAINSEIAFPIVPVTEVKLYDLDEYAIEPELPPTEPDDNPDVGGDDGDSELPENPTEPETKENDGDVEAPKEFTNLASEYLTINYPSPDPLGKPTIGSVIPLKAFPDNYQMILVVGYPVEMQEELVEQYDNPVLVKEKTCYSDDGIIRLVFNRPVQGNISVLNFELRINGELATIIDAYFKDECVELKYTLETEPDPEPEPDPDLPPVVEPETPDAGDENVRRDLPVAGDEVVLSFFEGSIYDKFQNFVQPIVEESLPAIAYIPYDEFQTPEPLQTEEVYESLAPSPIKNWILTRVGTLYSQRTEIALRAGKSNDAMFKDEFINNLLDPYRVRFFL